MNEGQTKFYHFIIERVYEEKKESAKKLLEESFSKQASGTFNQEYLESFVNQMMEMIKPEAKEEVQNIMENYRKQSMQ